MARNAIETDFQSSKMATSLVQTIYRDACTLMSVNYSESIFSLGHYIASFIMIHVQHQVSLK